LNRGGAETWLVQVLHHIDRSKYQFDFLVHTAEPGAYDEEVKALGARVIPCLKPPKPLQYALNFRRILREYGPYDCVHSHVHHYSGYVLMLAAMMRVPMRIAHGHSDTRSIDDSCSLLRRAYLSTMEALIRRFATDGIAVSENAAAALFSDCWKSDPRWSLCTLGIDLRPFQQTVDSRQLRAQLGIPADAFVVGHVGRFVEVKNHRFLVEIAEHFCKLEPKAVFLLVGDGPLKSEIEALVSSRGLDKHFIFTGIRSDVPRLMKGAMDCFLFPSSYEGLGLVLWEAQAAGLECLLSDIVPEEADVIPPLITLLRLDVPAEHWAKALFTIRNRSTFPAKEEIITNLRMQRVSIETSAERLMMQYDGTEIISHARHDWSLS
jgi:glycosyltransferase involved in cell wall biosynthesis